MNTSPVQPVRPSKTETFDFPQAIRHIASGYKVTKLEWDNQEYYLQMVNEHLMIHKPDTKQFHDLIVSYADMIGTDYILID